MCRRCGMIALLKQFGLHIVLTKLHNADSRSVIPSRLGYCTSSCTSRTISEPRQPSEASRTLTAVLRISMRVILLMRTRLGSQHTSAALTINENFDKGAFGSANPAPLIG